MEIANRLQQIIKQMGFSATSFADEIGVQRSSISHVVSGRNKPSLEFIEKIFMRFPEADIQWLITGVKSSFLEGQKGRLKIDDEGRVEENKIVKKIEKIVVFYSDQTFTSFEPNEKQN